MKIDTSTGSIEFRGGRLDPALTKNAFLSTPFASEAVVTVDNGPWVTYDLKLEDAAAASVVFEDQRLREVRLAITDPEESRGDWTETVELARKERHDTWLREELGDIRGRFAWGSVESVFDPRALCSQIIIRYS